jgi:opacity protein-like surface antigen
VNSKPTTPCTKFAFAAAVACTLAGTANAATFIDPIGDATGGGPDLISITASYDASNLYLSASFASAINSHNLGIGIFIDADSNPATGLTAASGPNVGADYGLTYIFGLVFPSSNFSLSAFGNGGPLGNFTPQF